MTRYHVRRRRWLVGAVIILVVGWAAVAAADRLAGDSSRALRGEGPALHGAGGGPRLGPGPGPGPAVSRGWPPQGEAALAIGDAAPSASPLQRPVAIASVAKVMTAYLTLRQDPLSTTQSGFTVTVSAAAAQAVARDRAGGQSVVAVQAGEQLTERQLLEALLIPSGNNIARMLAAALAGSEPRFVAEMNGEARALGMDHTTYTDPSGFDPSTVSTAADQLRVFRAAMRFPVFREIVSTGSVTLPIAGTMTNFDPLIDEGYAGKTGSDSAAGGCLAFFTPVTIAGRRTTAVGVVLGQGGGSDSSTLLAAAGTGAEDLVESREER